MDLAQYLHTEFEAYPKMFRDVVAFLSKEDVKQCILEPSALASDEYKIKTVSSKKGDRYIVVVDDEPSGEPQLSAAIAYWQLVSKKKFMTLELKLPIFKPTYLDRAVKWLREKEPKRTALFVEWVATLNVTKNIWSAHKKSRDYHLLSEEDKLYIDAIGVLIDAARKQSVLMMSSLSLDIRLVAGNVKAAELSVVKDREDCLEMFIDKLSGSFKSAYLGLLKERLAN